MGIFDELLNAMSNGRFDRLLEADYSEREYMRRLAEERTRNLASITEHIPQLVELVKLSDRDEMHSVVTGRGRRVWLMELGELEYFKLPGGTQHRMLYIGNDGNFYVFGPADFRKRLDEDGLLIDYDGASGKPVKLAMQPLQVSERTDHHLVALVRERVVSVFI